MAWSYSIQSVQDNPVPNGTKWVTVLYADGVGHSFTQSYKLVAGGNYTQAKVKAFLDARATELDNLDTVAIAIQQYIGQVFTP